jgi:RHS repeat-associated protein
VDTKTRDINNSDPVNQLNSPVIRYQYGNHLGSAILETDSNGKVISYEEYHPFGTSAYRSAKPNFNLSLKRYRFSNKERDDETGLYYFGARYYSPWLGRWTSSDPAGFIDGFNLYRFCSNNPITFYDPNGMDAESHIYPNKELGIEGVTDPHEASRGIRELGYDFTGFDPNTGEELPPDAQGSGVGVVKPAPWGWDVGTWLIEPNPSYSTVISGGKGDGESTAKTPTEVKSSVSSSERPETGTTGSAGAAASLTGPATERFIWKYNFPNQGVSGSKRGFILQNLFTNNWRVWEQDNVPNYDYDLQAKTRFSKLNQQRALIRDISGDLREMQPGRPAKQ